MSSPDARTPTEEIQETHVRTPDLAWREWAGFPGHIGVKVLREDKACGARTLLVKIPPRAEIPAHTHRGVVQHYVLEGTCETEGHRFSPGSFSLLPAHRDVWPIRSEEGATLLMVYDPVQE
jgi:quercetin dioxygenase-like cupin family protein